MLVMFTVFTSLVAALEQDNEFLVLYNERVCGAGVQLSASQEEICPMQ
jgi:hypothetical protein